MALIAIHLLTAAVNPWWEGVSQTRLRLLHPFAVDGEVGVE
jgi:hypothetical protein